ncbi:sulfotransferase family protein [Calidifontibacillus oryziterrae]|uniref:sulfotransferase family protein n=1 Tax=Calidifontibacillus oryziterrae TaxID=1191699 RepID=UPI0002F72AB1|nr:sulfotransferase [Calidifontibacillus oryziterrae]
MKVIIVGAGRSGTNMLRDILVSFDELGTWPCDEINYIWKHGNIRIPHDELDENCAKPQVKEYINGQFNKMKKKLSCDIIVEKTCANSLRVDFIEEVLDKPYYIHIYRDPIDTVASAMKRWTADLDIPYILKKAKYVPLSDFPIYGFKYLKNRMYKIRNKNNRLSSWGPVYKNMGEVLIQDMPLHKICAYQWGKCVEKSVNSFSKIDNNRVINIEYNSFINNPNHYLKKIITFLKIDIDENKIITAVDSVKKTSIGKGYQQLSQEEIEEVKAITWEVYQRANELNRISS